METVDRLEDEARYERWLRRQFRQSLFICACAWGGCIVVCTAAFWLIGLLMERLAPPQQWHVASGSAAVGAAFGLALLALVRIAKPAAHLRWNRRFVAAYLRLWNAERMSWIEGEHRYWYRLVALHDEGLAQGIAH